MSVEHGACDSSHYFCHPFFCQTAAGTKPEVHSASQLVAEIWQNSSVNREKIKIFGMCPQVCLDKEFTSFLILTF